MPESLQRLDHRVGVRRRALDVRPVEQRGDARRRSRPARETRLPMYASSGRNAGASLCRTKRDVARPPSSGTSVPMLRSRPSQMCRWVSTKPGHDDHARRVDRLGVCRSPGRDRPRRSGRPRSARRRIVKSPTAGSMREHGAAPDQRPARRARPEVDDPTGTAWGAAAAFGGRAPDHQPPGALVVPLDELLDVAQPGTGRSRPAPARPMIIGPSLGAQAQEGQDGEDEGEQQRRRPAAPMKVARPPASAAPPRTAAVMLVSA